VAVFSKDLRIAASAELIAL
jgi:ribonuclease HI